jgi:hypothetical protein
MDVESGVINKRSKSLNKGLDTLFRDLSIKGGAMELEAIVKWMDYSIEKIRELQRSDANKRTNSSKTGKRTTGK